MKLEVGMYVRTDNEIIGKIYEKIGDVFTYKDSNRDYITYGLTHNEILKASFNITDLIEVGDYVNGAEVIGFEKDNDNKEYLQCGVGDYIVCTYYEDEIKSIVTKEQFEANCYKVVE